MRKGLWPAVSVASPPEAAPAALSLAASTQLPPRAICLARLLAALHSLVRESLVSWRRKTSALHPMTPLSHAVFQEPVLAVMSVMASPGPSPGKPRVWS